MSKPPPPEQLNRRLFWACAAEGALVGVAAFVAWLAGIPLVELINPADRQFQAILIGLAATVPMILFLVLMVRSDWQPLVELRRQVEKLGRQLLRGASPLALVTLAVLAGVGEEMLFRGALQPLFSSWLTPWGGVVAAGLLFGLAHPMSRTYVIVAAIGGLYLGALAQLTGEVLSATVAHAAYDIVALWWLVRSEKPSTSDQG